MILKEFNYYLKNGMSLEEIQGAILEKVNSLSDPFTGCIAHVFDANALKYYIVASDNVVSLYELDRNILAFNDSSNNINELSGLIDTKFSELTSRVDSVNNELGNRINEVNSNLENSINTKANQATTYNKTEVNNLVNAKANSNAVVALSGNQTINGVKTFSSPIVVPNGTANTHAVNLAQLNTKANSNAVVALSGNQTIEGVKTFSSVPIVATQPTNDNQVVNKAYVDGKSRKASWGLNWNAPIAVNAHTPLVIPNDGVIFLWGGEEFMNIGYPNDGKIAAFQFTPRNYTARSGMYSKLFSKSVAGGRETITEDPTENSFFLFGLGSGVFTGSTIHPLTTTLSFLPVREGDKVFLQYFYRFDRNYYYLSGIFFPFEK